MGEAVRVLLGRLLAAIPGTGQRGEHLYSPGDNLERSELAQLDTATRTIDIAMYSFTDRYLAEELAALASKGVRIRVYRDREQFAQETQWGVGTTTSILLAAGVEVRVKGARDLMHLKAMQSMAGCSVPAPRIGPPRVSSARTTMSSTSRRPKPSSGSNESSRKCGVKHRIRLL